MIVRLARTYAFLLLSITGLLLLVSLVIHGIVFISGQGNPATFDLSFFKCSVCAGTASCGFMKNGLTWTDQVKSSPKWMWRTAFGLGIYAIGVTALGMVLSQDSAMLFGFTAFPLASNAISFCLLYAALWSGYLGEVELARGAGASLAMVFISVAVLLFHFGAR